MMVTNSGDFDIDTFKQRYIHTLSAFDIFSAAYGSNLELDKFLLQHVLRSWGIDEKRHIRFHLITTMRRYKQVAYFVYWFIKLKPIQVKLQSVHDRACLANERFALSVAFNMLNIPLNAISKELFEKLEYTLHYRNFSAESLFVTFELLRRCSLT